MNFMNWVSGVCYGWSLFYFVITIYDNFSWPVLVVAVVGVLLGVTTGWKLLEELEK